MRKFLCDVKTAANIFTDIRKLRKEGAEVEVRKVKSVPVFNVGLGILDTVEGMCALEQQQKHIRFSQGCI